MICLGDLTELLRLRARLARLGSVAERYGEELDGWPAGAPLPRQGLARRRLRDHLLVEALALDLHEGLSHSGVQGDESPW